jgi:hypothetical protein
LKYIVLLKGRTILHPKMCDVEQSDQAERRLHNEASVGVVQVEGTATLSSTLPTSTVGIDAFTGLNRYTIKSRAITECRKYCL